MTIVDLIDFHGGFEFITRRITTRRKVRLLWLVALLTFFMSALLDNMTTTIIMVMLLRKIVPTTKERMLFASVIVIAANSGGAWSPIGDVTTIMLWMKGNVSSAKLIESLLLPCLVSLVIPLVIASRWLKGSLPETDPADAGSSQPDYISDGESRAILFLGCALLVAVPVFKSVTHLPPYMGMVTALGIMWVFTELMYRRKRNIEESIKCRVAKVLKHIDMSTILFFLGILMAVAALESAGILSGFATGLNEHLHNVYAINTLIGILSSVVDNVPLVAASMGMYPIPDAAAVAASADPTYAAMFVQDGVFWHLLAYCAGVGGSLLIIGSAAGVGAMGLENINYVWYFKTISLMAFVGYLAAAVGTNDGTRPGGRRTDRRLACDPSAGRRSGGRPDRRVAQRGPLRRPFGAQGVDRGRGGGCGDARSRHRRGAGTRSAGVGAPRGRRTSDAHLECDAQGGPPAL